MPANPPLTRWLWLRDYPLWLELFVALNFLCLTGDIALAHGSNRFRNPVEYIPLWFSFAAAIVSLFVVVLYLRLRRGAVWKNLGYFIAWSSILLGAAGVIYHLDSHFFYEHTLKSLTYTAPFAAPLAYMGLGCLLLINRMIPRETTDWPRWVLFFALGGFVGNFILSLADHATNGFFRWTEWIPVVSSALAVGFLFTVVTSKVTSGFQRLCSAILALQVGVGILGFVLHLQADLHGPSGRLIDNILSGAPPLAPLLLPNLSLLAWIGLQAFSDVGQTGDVGQPDRA